MALPSRDRVGVDLRGIGDAVRAAARARRSTVAAFAREALVEAIGRPSMLPEVIAAEVGRAELVKLTLRLREPEAESPDPQRHRLRSVVRRVRRTAGQADTVADAGRRTDSRPRRADGI